MTNQLFANEIGARVLKEESFNAVAKLVRLLRT